MQNIVKGYFLCTETIFTLSASSAPQEFVHAINSCKIKITS